MADVGSVLDGEHRVYRLSSCGAGEGGFGRVMTDRRIVVDGEDRGLGNTASFVVRVWWDETDDALAWRAWVQHAASGDSWYFQTVEEATRFVEHYTCALSGDGAKTSIG